MRVNVVFTRAFLSFLVICRLIDFQVCEIIGASKNEFFNFSHIGRIKQYIKKKLKTIRKLLSLQSNHFSRNSNKSRTFFCFFTENLTLSLPGTLRAGTNTSPVVGGFHLEKISNKLQFGTVTKNYVLNHQKIAPMFLTWGTPKIHNGCQRP